MIPRNINKKNVIDAITEEKKLYPIKSYSWTIISANIFTKEMDKSSFLHHGTGIPQDIRFYLGIDDMKKGEQRKIEIKYGDVYYEAKFEMDNLKVPRTRLMWKTDFQNLIKEKLPDWYDFYLSNKKANDELPKIRFENTEENKNCFLIDFINPKEIVLDIECEIDEEQGLKEGLVKYYFGKRYERKPENRKKAIEIHGTICKICGFDFEEVYGERGKGFIEIHHTKPISSLENEETINPLTDLIPVCSNCHRMIHRRKDNILNIDKMSKIIEK